MNGKLKNMVLNRNDISAILQSSSHDFIRPIMSKGDQTKFVNATFVNQNFSDVVAQFKMLWNKAMVFMNPSPEGIQKVGGFFAVAESTNIYGYGIILSFNLILLGILNLIPLPGFNVGNAIISTIEIRRRKYYNRKKKNVVGSISIALVILFLVIGL
ncbi:MAG: hypothetical protein JKX79_07665 [Labilibaculum sp.]|nr:hypothetical protein [Labilibaculum sp.]